MPQTSTASPTLQLEELRQERKHLLATIDILEEISGTLHFVDILQAITRKLGELYGLDRASIFLAERRGSSARLVASYENPAIRNFLVDSRGCQFDKGRNSIAPALMEHLVEHVEQNLLVGGERQPLQRNLHAGLEIGLEETLDGSMGVFALVLSDAAGDVDPSRVAREAFEG